MAKVFYPAMTGKKGHELHTEQKKLLKTEFQKELHLPIFI